MPHLAQHEAAELWEVCRDHLVGAATLRMIAQGVGDPQLRSTLERHVHDFERAAHRIQQFLHEPGAGGYPTGYSGAADLASPAPQFQGSHSGQATWGSPPAAQGTWGGPAAGYAGSGVSLYDVTAAAACLDKCKSMAVKCTIAATEASQPARSYLYQLAGEHLRMAEEHYHWLDRHNAYASPRADHTAINDYSQKLRQFAQAGQQLAQRIASGYIPQAVAQGGPTAVGVAPEHTQSGWSVAPGGMSYTPGSGMHQTASGQHATWSSHEFESRGYAPTQHGGHDRHR